MNNEGSQYSSRIRRSIVNEIMPHAGTCRVYADGINTVEACENGSYTVTDRHGHKRVYGEPNAGFERYPGQEGRAVYERRAD